MEPLRDDVLARLQTIRPRMRMIDQPAAKVIATVINLRTGKRRVRVYETPAPPPVILVARPKAEPPEKIIAGGRSYVPKIRLCVRCREVVPTGNLKWCGVNCQRAAEREERTKFAAAIVPTTSPPHNKTGLTIWAVAAAFAIEEARILGMSHSVRDSTPRRAAMRILYTRFGLSLTQIGGVFKRDHTSVLSACRRAEQQLADDPEFARRYRIAEDTIREHGVG